MAARQVFFKSIHSAAPPSPTKRHTKILVIGAGNAGTAIAQTILTQDLADKLVLIHGKPDKLHREMLDPLTVLPPPIDIDGHRNPTFHGGRTYINGVASLSSFDPIPFYVFSSKFEVIPNRHDSGYRSAPAMTNALQQQPRAGNATIVEQFWRLQLPSFEGSTSLLVVEDWIREMEKIFNFMECIDIQKVTCAVYMLKQGASHWWEMTSRAWDVERNPITWLRTYGLQTYGEVLQRAQILENDDKMLMKAESKERGECYRKIGVCFKCGKHGHIFKNFPNVGMQLKRSRGISSLKDVFMHLLDMMQRLHLLRW
ncbi:hypothetical protein FEM48_Zijuj02G0169800 [Ziziphus jujuba var. spinosa]|uniref:Uncharacterized protein n=1 Tax=Ziziphus jujuba var. spinosa TaxID=714518 RepID=A0A978VWV6_ZIZJJ|nr:hypothetical protein FEM48_Zijuj02G0169800 [Ziziphus jujuba var. spinosa]